MREDIEVHSDERRLVLGNPTEEDRKYIYPITLDGFAFAVPKAILDTFMGKVRRY